VTLAILAEVIRVFLQSLQTNVGIASKLGHDQFVSNASVVLPLNST
jgi:hypothetical protein